MLFYSFSYHCFRLWHDQHISRDVRLSSTISPLFEKLSMSNLVQSRGKFPMLDMADVMAGVKLSYHHHARMKVNSGISLFAASVFVLRMPSSFAFSPVAMQARSCSLCFSSSGRSAFHISNTYLSSTKDLSRAPPSISLSERARKTTRDSTLIVTFLTSPA